jgi:hypothetical protein
VSRDQDTENYSQKRDSWHARFEPNARKSKDAHPTFYGYVDGGLGVQYYVASETSVDDLQLIALSLAEMIIATASVLASECANYRLCRSHPSD